MPATGESFELVPLLARGVTGASVGVDLGDWWSNMRVELNVTAGSGTSPTLLVKVQDSLDNGATWNDIGSFAQKTGVANEVINITTPFGRLVRVSWTIGGTGGPSFTFTVVAVTHDD